MTLNLKIAITSTKYLLLLTQIKQIAIQYSEILPI